MQINLQGKNLELTQEVKDYLHKKITHLEKYTLSSEEEAVVNVELIKTTNHHKKGEIFKAEANLSFGGNKFFAVKELDDVFKAIDAIKDDLERKIVQTKTRNHSLFIRGARSVKKMMKGLSKRNPFTSKY
ncbi:MAG: ribosome-associated translation inhibitor RaiA [bacterium]|nr:ribosome-associated translation inhibitor RaiA [bacterium]